jgi:diguanylate cyclase (GGDEF)-like protein
VLLSHACAVAAATAEYFCATQKGKALIRIHELADVLFAIKQEAVQGFVEKVQKHVMENCDLLETDVSMWGEPSEILAVAMEQLSQLAVASVDATTGPPNSMQVNQENQRLKRRVEDLLHRSITDQLTELFNRAHFDEQLPQWIRNARGGKRTVGLLFLDVDHFKKINDTHGHAVGDEVLKEFARRLLANVRATDTVARLSGDEFVIILEDLKTEQEVLAVAAKIANAVRLPFVVAGAQLAVTTSVGIALFSGGGQTHEELLANADSALYGAKRNGRDGVIVHGW